MCVISQKSVLNNWRQLSFFLIIAFYFSSLADLFIAWRHTCHHFTIKSYNWSLIYNTFYIKTHKIAIACCLSHYYWPTPECLHSCYYHVVTVCICSRHFSISHMAKTLTIQMFYHIDNLSFSYKINMFYKIKHISVQKTFFCKSTKRNWLVYVIMLIWTPVR